MATRRGPGAAVTMRSFLVLSVLCVASFGLPTTSTRREIDPKFKTNITVYHINQDGYQPYIPALALFSSCTRRRSAQLR